MVESANNISFLLVKAFEIHPIHFTAFARIGILCIPKVKRTSSCLAILSRRRTICFVLYKFSDFSSG